MVVYVLSKIDKIIYTSVNPSFTIYKMGFKWHKFYVRVTVILFGAEIICKSSNYSMWGECFTGVTLSF